MYPLKRSNFPSLNTSYYHNCNSLHCFIYKANNIQITKMFVFKKLIFTIILSN